jgi:WD40 repeat protein
VSENGLLVAAADGGGTVVVFRKYPEWEAPSEHDGSETDQAPVVSAGMTFSPTSSYAGSAAADVFTPDSSGYQEVARLRHSHRVRSLMWATEPGWPVLGAGSADGRVRLWRPMGEGQVEVNVSGLRLQNVKPGKEDIYAVVSVGRKIRIGSEVVMDWTVNFPREEDNVFELLNSRQVINVVLYVRPKQKKPGGLQRQNSLDLLSPPGAEAGQNPDGEAGQPFSRVGSLDTGGGESGEGAMAKLIKKKEVLVGKGSAPRMFDRVTIAEEYSKVS